MFSRVVGLNEEWDGEYFFIQMADTQLGFMNENQSWEEEIELASQAVEHINRLKPKFAVVCGDLIHCFPNQDAEQTIRKKQVEDLIQIFNKVLPSIPLVCVCGNHDVGNAPTRESIEIYERDFGRHYFSFAVGGVFYVALNSQLYSDPSGAPDLYEEQHRWLEQQLDGAHRSNKFRHLVVFVHIPLFLKTPQDPDEYFTIPQVRRKRLLQLLIRYKVRACFAGHYHRNAEGKAYYDEGKKGEYMMMVTTTAVGKQLGDDKSGFRVVFVEENKLAHNYYPFENVPEAL